MLSGARPAIARTGRALIARLQTEHGWRTTSTRRPGATQHAIDAAVDGYVADNDARPEFRLADVTHAPLWSWVAKRLVASDSPSGLAVLFERKPGGFHLHIGEEPFADVGHSVLAFFDPVSGWIDGVIVVPGHSDASWPQLAYNVFDGRTQRLNNVTTNNSSQSSTTIPTYAWGGIPAPCVRLAPQAPKDSHVMSNRLSRLINPSATAGLPQPPGGTSRGYDLSSRVAYPAGAVIDAQVRQGGVGPDMAFSGSPLDGLPRGLALSVEPGSFNGIFRQGGVGTPVLIYSGGTIDSRPSGIGAGSNVLPDYAWMMGMSSAAESAIRQQPWSAVPQPIPAAGALALLPVDAFQASEVYAVALNVTDTAFNSQSVTLTLGVGFTDAAGNVRGYNIAFNLETQVVQGVNPSGYTVNGVVAQTTKLNFNAILMGTVSLDGLPMAMRMYVADRATPYSVDASRTTPITLTYGLSGVTATTQVKAKMLTPNDPLLINLMYAVARQMAEV